MRDETIAASAAEHVYARETILKRRMDQALEVIHSLQQTVVALRAERDNLGVFVQDMGLADVFKAWLEGDPTATPH